MYITLGSNCSVSNYLKHKKNYIHTTLPFDWSKNNLNKILKVFENNFENYIDLHIFKYSDNHSSYIIKNSYNISFAHEILNKYELDNFKKILNNRILKFNKILNNYDGLKFVYLETSVFKQSFNNDLLKLLKFLKINKCTNNTFYLFLHISYKGLLEDSIKNNKKIIITYFENYNKDWKYSNINWNNILL